MRRRGRIRRFLRYNLVGLLGLGVKFSVLTALVELCGLGHLLASAIAVEATVLHNFTWHLRYTWRDRCEALPARGVLARLLRFHLANGVVGMTTNLVLMRLLVDDLGLHYLAANAVATATSGVVNFLLSELVVFVAPARQAQRRPVESLI